MGYTTTFDGAFTITPPLTAAQVEEVQVFGEQRHDGAGLMIAPGMEAPGIWCDWTPSADGAALAWSGAEKFYRYTEWLNALTERFFRPWGVQLSGKVHYQGESPEDHGWVAIVDGVARRYPDAISSTVPI